jgi:hypothetical protein
MVVGVALERRWLLVEWAPKRRSSSLPEGSRERELEGGG